MKKLFAIAMMASAVLSYAEEARTESAPQVEKSHKKVGIPKAKFDKMIYKRTGGTLAKPGSMKGRISFVNCQKSAPADWIVDSAKSFASRLKCNIGVEDGAFDFQNPRLSGNATLFVVDDDKLPNLLAAPENRWALVNVAPLKKGAGSDVNFLKARVSKELLRGFALLAGAQTSKYPNPLMGCITSPEGLDAVADIELPVDVTSRFKGYLAGYGVEPRQDVSYRIACQEGWAPVPTNDVQKAMWDEAHSIPSKPLKLEK